MSFVSESGCVQRKYRQRESGKVENIELFAGVMLGIDETSSVVPLVICNPDSFNFRERHFNENKDPRWRMQVASWDRSKWEWFFNMLETDPAGTPVTFDEKYAGDAIHPIYGTEWQYPVWVLEKCIEKGWITKPHFIQQIQKRKLEEEKLGLNQTNVEITSTVTEPEVDTAKQKAAFMKMADMNAALDPKDELKQIKKRTKKPVEVA